MSDDNDLELKFGADASGVEAGAEQTIASVEAITAALEGLTTAMAAQTEAITAGFAQMAAASEATRTEMEKDFEEEEAGLLGLVGSVREGVESFQELKESITGFGELILAAFAVEAIAEFVEKMGEAGEKTQHTAEFFGMTVSEVQALQARFVAAGAGPDALSSSFAKLERAASAAVSGSQRQAAAFQAIGVDLTVARTPAELMTATLDGLAASSDKAQLAIAIFGRGAQSMAGILSQTKEQADELAESNAKFGIVWPEATQRAAQLGEALNTQKNAMQGLSNVMADALAPAFTRVVDAITDFVHGMVESYQQGGLVRDLMAILSSLIDGVSAVFDELGQIAATAMGLVSDNTITAHTALETFRLTVISAAAALVTIGVMIQDTIIFLTALGSRLDATNAQMSLFGRQAHDALVGDYSGLAEGKLQAGINAATAGYNNMGAAMAAAAAHGQTLIDNLTKINTVGQGDPGEGSKRTTPQNLGKDPKDTGAEDALQAAREAFEAQEAAHRGMIDDMTADELAFWKMYEQSAEYAGLTDKQQATVRLNVAKLERQEDLAQINEGIADKKNAAAEAIAAIQDELQASQAAAAQKIATINASEKEGVLSRQQGLVQIKAIITDELVAATSAADRILLARIQVDEDIKAVSASTTQAYKQAQADEVKANADRNRAVGAATAAAEKAILAATNQNAEAQAAASKKMYTQIGDFARTTTEGLIEGTMTWAQAFDKVLEGMLDLFLQFVEKQVIAHLVGEQAKTGATAAGTAERLILEAAAAVQSIAISAAKALAQIASEAAVAAAGAYAALAAVPIIGPVLAPAAAAAALAAVLALGSKVFSSFGGMGQVQNDGDLFQLHKDETVLPADIATPLRSALRGGALSSSPTVSSIATQVSEGGLSTQASGAAGGDLNVYAWDGPSVNRWLNNGGGDLIAAHMGRRARNMKGNSGR